MHHEITVTLKFFSGIDKSLGLQNYDPSQGVKIKLTRKKMLRTILRELGVTHLSSNIYFMNGERVSTWKRLGDGSEVSCLKPSGGG